MFVARILTQEASVVADKVATTYGVRDRGEYLTPRGWCHWWPLADGVEITHVRPLSRGGFVEITGSSAAAVHAVAHRLGYTDHALAPARRRTEDGAR